MSNVPKGVLNIPTYLIASTPSQLSGSLLLTLIDCPHWYPHYLTTHTDTDRLPNYSTTHTTYIHTTATHTTASHTFATHTDRLPNYSTTHTTLQLPTLLFPTLIECHTTYTHTSATHSDRVPTSSHSSTSKVSRAKAAPKSSKKLPLQDRAITRATAFYRFHLHFSAD